MYLRNAWYVAARAEEIGEGLTPLRLLDEPVVLYRCADGSPAVLEDACPHRKLPLSMGRRLGDTIECGYHGLTFDAAGSCVRAPGIDKPPRAAKVRRYPAAERYGLIWVWMGEEEKADPALILAIPEWDDPAWGRNQGGAMNVDCHYLYITDNLLDPSHVAWVHRSSFGNAACEDEPLDVAVAADGVTVSRWMRNVEVAPFYAPFVGFAGNCDRLQHYEVRYPAHAVIKAIFTPAGSGGRGPLPDTAFVMNSYNFMTPVDQGRTRYFWFQTRNFAPGDEAISTQFDSAVRQAFDEDRTILAAVHAGIERSGTSPINLPIDVGPLRFRRGLEGLIEREADPAL